MNVKVTEIGVAFGIGRRIDCDAVRRHREARSGKSALHSFGDFGIR